MQLAQGHLHPVAAIAVEAGRLYHRWDLPLTRPENACSLLPLAFFIPAGLLGGGLIQRGHLLDQGRVDEMADPRPVGFEGHLAILFLRHVNQLVVPAVGITQLQFTLLTAADPAGGHLVGKVFVAGRGIVSGVIGTGKGGGE